MIIETLETSPIKGREYNLRLQPLNLITADNMAGKTAVFEAAQIGFYGCVPRLGERHADTFELSTDPRRLVVTLGFDNGQENKVQFLRDMDTGSITRTEARFAVTVPRVLCDPNEYFSLTKDGRNSYVLGRADMIAAGYSDEVVLEKIRALPVLPPEVGEPIKAKWVAFISESITKRKKSATSVHPWLGSLVASLDTERKRLQSIADTESATMVSLRSSGEIPKDVSAALEAHRKTVLDLHHKRQKVLESKQESAARDSRLSVINGSLAYYEDHKARIAKIKKEIERLKPLPAQPKDNESDLLRTVDEYQAEMNSSQGRMSAFDEQISGVSQDIKVAKHLKECPSCSNTSAGWKVHYMAALESKKRQLVKQADRLKAHLAKTAVKLGVFRKRFSDASDKSTKYSVRKAELNSRESELRVLQAELETAKALEQERDELYKALPFDADRMKIADDVLAAATTEMTLLETKQSAYTVYRENRKSAVAAETWYISAKCEADFLQAIIKKVIQPLSAYITGTAFNSLLSVSRHFTDGFLRSALQYKDGDLGYTRTFHSGHFLSSVVGSDGWWVNRKAFSGLEELLAFAGMSVALCQSSPIKLVMMDELGNLHPKLKSKLLDRMDKLVNQRVIDQFIGVDVRLDDYDDCRCAFNHIKL